MSGSSVCMKLSVSVKRKEMKRKEKKTVCSFVVYFAMYGSTTRSHNNSSLCGGQRMDFFFVSTGSDLGFVL